MNFNYEYLEKVYAGLLGKIIGVRLGAPIEPLFWTSEKIREVFGEIDGYVKNYRNFAADDDVNGPVIFIRAIEDAYAKKGEITAVDIGNAWLNYTAEGHGMFWWGGFGTSTEHTAYDHLSNGIKPPESGSASLNGSTVAEQIGGQIFIDTWGLICPGNPGEAARLAGMAASVSHDLNGVYGASYIAACIAMAFEEKNVEKIVLECRKYIPKDCEYRKMIDDVYDFYKANPDDWRKALEYVDLKYTKERYPGVVHIIPNSAYIIISLLYGAGDFSNTLRISVMCGWDTDCNAGNVGVILGVANGIDGIDMYWRNAFSDFIVTSSVVGSLNINDVPTLAKRIAGYGAVYNGKQLPSEFAEKDHIFYDFGLPGSTHAMRGYPENITTISNTNVSGKGNTSGMLQMAVNFMRRNTEIRLYMKPFYRRRDFDDERYIPNFSPVAFPGQTMKCRVMTKDIAGIQEIIVKPYIQDTEGKQWTGENTYILRNGEWADIEYRIPSPLEGVAVEEIGVKIINCGRDSFYGAICMDYFEIYGKANYTIDSSRQHKEFGTITPFTYHKGFWSLENGKIQGICDDEANIYTGDIKWEDYELTGKLSLEYGKNAYMIFRATGNLKYYLFGFENGEIVFKRIDNSLESEEKETVISRKQFEIENGREYELRVSCEKDNFKCFVDGKRFFDEIDGEYSNGFYGYRIEKSSRVFIGNTEFREY